MPSSFTRVLPNAFGYSPRTPVSDCGTGRRFVRRRLFVAGRARDFRIDVPSSLRNGGVYHPAPSAGRRPASFNRCVGWRTINRLSIGYAWRPRLRSRLTLGGLPLPRKPGAFGGRASHPSYRYSFRHTHSPALHRSLPVRLPGGWRRSPTIGCPIRDCGGTLSPRHFRRGMARPVRCYALLKWWLLLSQHPGCHGDPTSFATERPLRGLGRRSGLFPFGAWSFSPTL